MAAAFRRRPPPRHTVLPPRPLPCRGNPRLRRPQRRRRHRRVVVVDADGTAPPSRPLVAPAGCRVSPLSPYRLALPSRPLIAPAGCCVSRRICRPILLRHPLVLSSRQLVVACRTPLSPYLVVPPSCPHVMPAGCCVSCRICRHILLRCPLVLLSLASPLSPYHNAPPSRPLVAPAGCCVSRCRPIVLRCPLILSSRRLVADCRVASICRHIVLRHPLVLLSRRLIVGCRVVALFCCALSSSRPLVAPAGCYFSRRLCCPIVLRCPPLSRAPYRIVLPSS